MTGAIPFAEIENDTVVIVNIIEGYLPSLADHKRMTWIHQLISLMNKCWKIDPRDRPTAKVCLKTVDWMVSRLIFKLAEPVP